MQRHRHQEFIRFLNAVEREIPAGKTVRAILDNYAAHKHPAVRQWLARHPRWTSHFTPTSPLGSTPSRASFATLTKRRLKRGVFRSVVDLQATINRFLEDHNAQSKPFGWVADPRQNHRRRQARAPNVEISIHSGACPSSLVAFSGQSIPFGS